MIIKELNIFSCADNKILKTYTFVINGLNIILGERKEEGKETNGVGKTTMVEAISYILGSSKPKDFNSSLLASKDIFLVLEVLVHNNTLWLARLINDDKHGYILSGSNALTYRIESWEKEESKKYKEYVNSLFDSQDDAPAFSSLREYIIRDEKKGFVDIGLPNRKAILESSYLAYLFNLPFTFEKEIADVKNKQKELSKKITLINSLKNEIGTLKMNEKKIEKEIEDLDKMIKRVNLNEKFSNDANQYRENKSIYNKLQKEIFELEHIKKQYAKNINNLEEKLNEIKLLNDIEPFYKQLIDYFPESVRKNKDEIFTFYNFMVDNRGIYFNHKIEEVNHEINVKTSELAEYSKVLENISRNFSNTDIVVDISQISDEKSKKYEELAGIKLKIKLYEEKTTVNSEINKLKQEILRLIEIKQDLFKGFTEDINKIKKIFADLLWNAYQETGVLDFELNNNTGVNDSTGRIKMVCKIDDEKSHGRLYMKINIFDLTWFIRGIENKGNINFLFHDGSYSKPDKYAKAKLLMYVDSKLKKLGKGQYFITLNVDELEKESIDEFDKMRSIVAKLRRGDEEVNRFFGFRYMN